MMRVGFVEWPDGLQPQGAAWEGIAAALTAECPTHAVPIPLTTIVGVALSPWMPTPLLNATRTALNAIPGCETA